MRRLFYPALILLPVLAFSQAQAQTSTLNAPQSRASVATLEAKAETPNVLPAVSAATSADPGTEIMVPVTQTVVERPSNAETKDATPTYNNATTTAPKLIEAKPLAMSLRDMESETAEASVVLQFTVDSTGTPKNMKVVHSGGAALDKRATEAVNLYRFKPATQNGLPVEAPVSVEIKLKKS
jgi:TonB family protein